MKFEEYAGINATVENNTIKSVLVLGPISKNGRKYTQKCMKEALPLYQGARVYVDHSTNTRSASERFGQLVNPTMSNDGIRADLKYLGSHPLSASVKEDVENKLNFFGLSHCVDASAHRTKEGLTIDTIHQVVSVDIVDRPATTRSLTEEVKLWEQEEEPEANDTDEALGQAVLAIYKDDALDNAQKLEKIKKVLDLGEELEPEGEEDNPKEDEKEEKSDVEEQVEILKTELESLKLSIKENTYIKPRTAPISECKEVDIKQLGQQLRGDL